MNKFWMILILMICGQLFASTSPEETLGKAVLAYQQTHFQEALTLFESLNEKANSFGLFYNIGNCYMKTGKIGQALSAYLSAQKRNPYDPDLLHNLNYARSQVPEASREEAPSGISGVLVNLVSHGSLRFHQKFFLFILTALVLAITYLTLKRGFDWKNGLFLSLLACLALEGGALFLRNREFSRKTGVVISQAASVRYGPSITDTSAFILKEGSEFEIFQEQAGWVQIRCGEGKTGWISSDQFSWVK